MSEFEVQNEQTDILVVDDTPANLHVLSGILKRQKYKVRPVTSGKTALLAAQKVTPDLILLDINMPDMNGYEVCRILKADENLKDVPVIFISALSDTMDKVTAFDIGAVDYITKPFHLEEVEMRVSTHLKLHKYRRELKHYNDELEKRVEEQVREISDSQLAMILAMSKLTESRDEDTGKHLERVQAYSREIALAMREKEPYNIILNDAFLTDLVNTCPLHDIGKVAIPDNILLKPARLTQEEFEIMKTHTLHGAETLEAVYKRYPGNNFIKMGIEIARSHHERWDGKGYPDGLIGPQIPISAQIMTVADVYDALRSRRCYKEPRTHEDTCLTITESKGTQFSPDVVNAFEKVNEKMRDIRLEFKELDE